MATRAPDGADKKACAKVCKVCGKEGHATDIKRHIENNHLEGVSTVYSMPPL